MSNVQKRSLIPNGGCFFFVTFLVKITYNKYINQLKFIIMATANLCKCTNCDSILIDENPQIEAKEYELVNEYAPENIKYMEWDEDVLDENDIHWICPECRTDSYLMDL